jgi:hypothetical protein
MDLELHPAPYPDPQLGKMLDPDPHQINADPQPWIQIRSTGLRIHGYQMF